MSDLKPRGYLLLAKMSISFYFNEQKRRRGNTTHVRDGYTSAHWCSNVGGVTPDQTRFPMMVPSDIYRRGPTTDRLLTLWRGD